MHPIIVVILLICALLLVSWLKRAPPEKRMKGVIYAAIAVAGLLVVTGRINPLMGAIVAGVALLQRVLSAVQMFDSLKGFAGRSGVGPASDVVTDYLRMSLDQSKGAMEGQVLKGQFAGRTLGELKLADLMALYNECITADRRSLPVLSAYLSRRFGAQWQAGTPGISGSTDLTRGEALEILGLESNATKEKVIEAHRRLMQKNHPDRGGTTFLASQINRAKDLLLNS
jgi:hypothetical protein